MSCTLSAGVIVVRFTAAEPRYLLLRAYRYWDFPKGEVRTGENPLDMAIREVEEETALTGLKFRWGHDYQQTPPYRRNKVARYYLAEAPAGEVSLPISAELGRPEHHEFRWLTYAAARALLNDRLRPILEWADAIVTRG